MITVAVADDHELFAQGIASLLEATGQIKVPSVAANGEELIRELENTGVDVLLLDIDMPRLNGKDTLEIVRKLWPQMKVAMLTMHDEVSYVKKYIDLQTDGYLLKNTKREGLLNAIKWIHAGNQFVSPNLLLKISKAEEAEALQKSEVDVLTEREIEIVRLTGKDMSMIEIADELCISVNTLKTHRRNILRKLELTNSVGITKFALEHNIV